MTKNHALHVIKRLLLASVLIILVAPLPAYTQPDYDVQHEIDSLLQLLPELEGKEKLRIYADLHGLYYESDEFDTNSALMDECIEEAHRQNIPMQEGLARARKVLLYINYSVIDKLENELPGHFDFWESHEQWDFYFGTKSFIINKYLYFNKTDKALKLAEESYHYAKLHNINYGLGSSAKNLGRIYFILNRSEEGEDKLYESIILLKKEETKEELYGAYLYLCEVLIELEKYPETETVLNEWADELATNERIAEAGGWKYDDFYNTEWYRLYLMEIDLKIQQYKLDEAEELIRKTETLSPAKNELGFSEVGHRKVTLYLFQKKHNQALELIDILYEIEKEKENMQAATNLLKKKKDIAYEAGMYKLAAELNDELSIRKDSLYRLDITARLDELRTIYEVDKITAEKERNRNYLFFALGICALLIVALGIWMVYSRKVTLKNRGLVRQIQEQDRLAEELEKKETELAKLQKLFVTENDEQQDKEDELYLRLKELMKDKAIYTDKEINRKILADKLGTNEKYLYETIRKQTGLTFSAYINNLRLNYARELLSNPDNNYTLDAIAADSGIGSRYTLHRLFRDKYNLSPEEFKRIANRKEKL